MVSRKGFTLVEILIVVVILGILAAIVIPQFSNASSDSKLATLKTNLQTVRCQLELYKIEHDDIYPVLASFEDAMVTTGKYLQKVPTNPFTGNAAIAASGTSAWIYVVTTDANGIESATFNAGDGGTTNGEAHNTL